MTIGKRIALRIKDLNLTQTKLAQRSGLTQQAISNTVNGKSKPSYNAIVALSLALEVPPSWFFEGTRVGGTSSQEFSQPPTPSPTQTNAGFFPASGPGDPDLMGKRPPKRTIVIGHYLPMKDLPHPIQAYPIGIASAFYSLIFNPLVQQRDGRLCNMLAADWKKIGKSWFFRLREGVRFHNRKRMTTEDVRWSYEHYLMQNPDERWIESVEVVDESIMAIHLKSECRAEDLPSVLITPAETSEWVGTGPFKAIELKPGSWKLRKNAHYFLSNPLLDEIQVREYDTPSALEKALVAGEVHFALDVSVEGEDLVTEMADATQRYHLSFILKEPPLQHRALRKAISLGLDRREIAKAANLRAPLYSNGPFDYVLEDRNQRTAMPDLDTAKQLLHQVPDLDRFVLRVNSAPFLPYNQQLNLAVVAELNRMGIQAEIGDNPHLLLAVHNVMSLDLEYQLWETGNRYNLAGYSNPDVDQLIQEYRKTSPTPTQLWELRQLLIKDLPDIPLFYSERPLTYVKRLRALEDRKPLLLHLNEIHTWYLEPLSP